MTKCWFHKWERKKAFTNRASIWDAYGCECKKCGERKIIHERRYGTPRAEVLNEAYAWRDKVPSKSVQILKLVK